MLITDELYFTKLIATVIKLEVQHKQTTSASIDPKVLFFKLGSVSLERQISRQASFIFHVLYRGEANRVKVVDSMDNSINGRIGIITGYDTNKRKFIVRLCTRSVSNATFFTGEKRAIEAGFLQQIPHIHYRHTNPRINGAHQDVQPLPTSFSAILTAVSPEEGCIHYTTILIYKTILDVIKSSCTQTNRLSMGMLRPIVDTFRAHIGTSKDSSSSSCGEKSNIQHTSQYSQLSYADCGRIVWCAQCDTREICDHHGCNKNGDPGNKSASKGVRQSCAEQFVQSSRLDPDLLLKPDNIRFVLPFQTHGSTLLSASLQLNEMNVSSYIRSTPLEADIYRRLLSDPISVTNRDLYSLYPHEHITDSIINMCSFWYVH